MIVPWLLTACLSLSGVFCRGAPLKWQSSDRGPLYDYVYRSDPVYSWFEFDTFPQNGFTTYYINMTSQTWNDKWFSNRPVWWHYLVIHVPNNIVHSDAAFLFISHGSNNDGPPHLSEGDILRTGDYANTTGIVTATLRMIPNQPITFENDGVERHEDEIISWTWKRFYNESHVGIKNPEVLLRMAMCKASARAMDTIQDFVLEVTDKSITKFMVAGQSKRGWTTWTMGGIDDRIVAIAPVVLSCLNLRKNFHHYWRSWGGWSFALNDYWNQGILGLIDEPEVEDLAKIVDPYSDYYRPRMTMPKLMVSGASDVFFMLDDYDYFFKDLPGEKYIWIQENTGHGGGPLYNDYWKMLQTFYITVLTNYQRPTLEWVKNTTDSGGQIVLLSPTKPVNISAWSAPSVVTTRQCSLCYVSFKLKPLISYRFRFYMSNSLQNT